MKILALGGIAESKELAQKLIDQHYPLIYSIAGIVRQPQLDCEIHSGGFSGENHDGITGMVDYISEQQIELVIDATHPYAAEISANAVAASRISNIPCWRFSRPGWDLNQYRNWRFYENWDELMNQIKDCRRPFFSIGRSALDQVYRQPDSQHWIVRSAVEQDPVPNVTIITAIGPFSYEDEFELLKTHNIDALITKDSGCQRVVNKVRAASDLNIPIYIQSRPPLEKASRDFDAIEDLLAALQNGQ